MGPGSQSGQSFQCRSFLLSFFRAGRGIYQKGNSFGGISRSQKNLSRPFHSKSGDCLYGRDRRPPVFAVKKVRFVTLGCKVNQYETQAMRESFQAAGLCEVKQGTSDVVVINTCTVTEEADRGNRYWIRRLRRENPSAKIVVTGCWGERNRREIEPLPGVDLVLSNHEKGEIVRHLFQGCGTPEIQKGENPKHRY